MKKQLILWVLLFAFHPVLQAQGLNLEPEPRPYRASVFESSATFGYAVEWRPYQRFSLVFLEKRPDYREVECLPGFRCPGQAHIVDDLGAHSLGVRVWFFNDFYLSGGIMKSNGFSQRVFRSGDQFTVGGRSVTGGTITFQSTVPPEVTPTLGFGAQYITEEGLVLWMGVTDSTQLHQGDPSISTTNPNVTQADLHNEVAQNQHYAIASRKIWAALTAGYAF